MSPSTSRSRLRGSRLLVARRMAGRLSPHPGVDRERPFAARLDRLAYVQRFVSEPREWHALWNSVWISVASVAPSVL